MFARQHAIIAKFNQAKYYTIHRSLYWSWFFGPTVAIRDVHFLKPLTFRMSIKMPRNLFQLELGSFAKNIWEQGRSLQDPMVLDAECVR